MKPIDLQLECPPCSDPIFVHTDDGKLSAALMIEQIEFNQKSLIITGWTVGKSSLTLSLGSKETAFSIQRHSRLDVAQKFSLQEQQYSEFGFTLTAKATTKAIFDLIWEFPNVENKNTLHFSIQTNKFKVNKPKSKTVINLLKSKINLRPPTEILPKRSDDLLIIGSAPSIKSHIKDIKKFQGERWALNDSWFWLEKQGITVDKVFITDSRFIKKSIKSIGNAHCSTIVTTHTVDLSFIKHVEKNIHVFQALGRDGFSLKYGEVFHGCSVFFTALQTAFHLKYHDLTVCGVSLPPPASYFRIDGSSNMPEYVHNIQLNNAHLALSKLRDFDINLKILEPQSNLNFL